MNNNQITFLRNFERTTKFTSRKGGSLSLTTIIDSIRHDQPCGDAMAEYVHNVHPWLYYHFVADFTRIRDAKLPKGFNDGNEFGRHVVKIWREACWKQKFYNYDLLSIYDNYDQLREATDALLNKEDGLTFNDRYTAIEERLYEIRQRFLDAQEQERQRQAAADNVKREALIAENKLKEAQRIAEQARRNAAAYENEQQARKHRQLKQEEAPANSSLLTPNSSLPSTPNSSLPPAHSSLLTPNSSLPTPSSQLESDIKTLTRSWIDFYPDHRIFVSLHFDLTDSQFAVIVEDSDDQLSVCKAATLTEAIRQSKAHLVRIDAEARAAAQREAKRRQIEQEIALQREQFEQRMKALTDQLSAL